jgi:hypothetical protein
MMRVPRKVGGKEKRQALPDMAREAALETAAATLAAIHMAKQVGAQVLPRRDESGARGPLTPEQRLPLGDVLFGVAQLQVDFARRLFEFNKSASVMLRDRLRSNFTSHTEKAKIKVTWRPGDPHRLCFTIKNCASLSKTFTFRAELGWPEIVFEPASITIAAGCPHEIHAIFSPALGKGTYSGYIAVESQGIRVELLPFEIKVAK